jgi:hypothetical protein
MVREHIDVIWQVTVLLELIILVQCLVVAVKYCTPIELQTVAGVLVAGC